MKKKLRNKEPHCLELKLANGRTRTFSKGYDMWQWAVQNGDKMEFDFNERTGPFLCDYFEKRRKK